MLMKLQTGPYPGIVTGKIYRDMVWFVKWVPQRSMWILRALKNKNSSG